LDRWGRILDTTSRHAVEFQVQIAVPAEELRCGASSGDLKRIQSRVEAVFLLARTVCRALEPNGWRVLTVRFEEEVCVTLVRHATADVVRNELAQLPSSILSQVGDTVHICVSVGEHIFELAFADGGLRPFSLVDRQSSGAPA
jgi:hypothetical protein